MDIETIALAESIKSGVYRHYKGDLYYVLGVASNSTNRVGDEVELGVIYLSLNALGHPESSPLHYREIHEFCSLVGEEEIHADGVLISQLRTYRFTYVGLTPLSPGPAVTQAEWGEAFAALEKANQEITARRERGFKEDCGGGADPAPS